MRDTAVFKSQLLNFALPFLELIVVPLKLHHCERDFTSLSASKDPESYTFVKIPNTSLCKKVSSEVDKTHYFSVLVLK